MEQTLSKGELEIVINELWTDIQQTFSSDYNDTNYNYIRAIVWCI